MNPRLLQYDVWQWQCLAIWEAWRKEASLGQLAPETWGQVVDCLGDEPISAPRKNGALRGLPVEAGELLLRRPSLYPDQAPLLPRMQDAIISRDSIAIEELKRELFRRCDEDLDEYWSLFVDVYRSCRWPMTPIEMSLNNAIDAEPTKDGIHIPQFWVRCPRQMAKVGFPHPDRWP